MYGTNSANEYRVCPKLMGSAFELIVVDTDSIRAKNHLDAGIREIQRLEEVLSEFISTSAISSLNRFAGIRAVPLSKEVFDLLERCQQIADLTQGAFDITVGPLKKLYAFKKRQITFPDKEKLEVALKRTGYQHLVLDPNTHSAFLSQQGMHTSLAAIGKGYAADRVKAIWQREGVHSGVINASGDLTAFGQRADGSPWQLAIADPDDKNKILFHLPVQQASVATSGDYEQYFMHRGVRYAHSIHPRTGLPVRGVKSVTVFSPSAELSDALATAVFIMGVKTGLHFIDQLPKTHCIFVDDQNRSFFSKEIKLKYGFTNI